MLLTFLLMGGLEGGLVPARTCQLLCAEQVHPNEGIEELAYLIRHPEICVVMFEFVACNSHPASDV